MTSWLLRLDGHDARVLSALLRRRHARLDRLFGTVTHLGGAAFAIAAGLAYGRPMLLTNAIPGHEEAECARARVVSERLSALKAS